MVLALCGVAHGGLAHYWDFEDAVNGSTDPLADTANNYVEGSGLAPQDLVTSGGNPHAWQAGRDGGQSIESHQYLKHEAAGLTEMPSKSFTVETWMRLDGSNRGWFNPIGYWGGSAYIHTGKGNFWAGVGGTTYCTYSITDQGIGEWYYMAVVADFDTGLVTAYHTKDGDPLTVYAHNGTST
jgi:hypothetical protein